MAVLEALPSRNIFMQITERDWGKLLVFEGAIGGAQHPACPPCSAEQSAPEELEFPLCDITLAASRDCFTLCPLAKETCFKDPEGSHRADNEGLLDFEEVIPRCLDPFWETGYYSSSKMGLYGKTTPREKKTFAVNSNLKFLDIISM